MHASQHRYRQMYRMPIRFSDVNHRQIAIMLLVALPSERENFSYEALKCLSHKETRFIQLFIVKDVLFCNYVMLVGQKLVK